MDSLAEYAISIGIAELDVNLEYPNRCYAPGDTITGSMRG